MKLKDIKPLITGEYITLFEVFHAKGCGQHDSMIVVF